MWNQLIRAGLTPNQFYLLYSIKESTTTVGINLSLELKVLKQKGYVKEDNRLTAPAVKLIKEVEGHFKRKKKKTNEELMGNDWLSKCNTYNQIFPNERFPSGRPARASIKDVEKAFSWFFANYDYTWQEVFKATAIYLDEKEKLTPRYAFANDSYYFIRKQNQADKSFQSVLAGECEMVRSGAHNNVLPTLKDKVF